MTSWTVIYDASVLYPAPLRDFLMWLALTNLFRARWTDEIHDEWIRNVLKNRPDLTLAQLNRTKNLMNINVHNCLVTNYASLIPRLKLPDPNDRHVLAAAIQTQADFIVTFNLKDFPDSVLDLYEIEAIHPDEFIIELIERDSKTVAQAAEKQRSTLKNPPLTRDRYLEILKQQGLPKTVNLLTDLLEAEI
ncbi:PIN domain-containing protein [Aphanothece hegewaldii CCALA 016]|uniref:PIN domain-containing protein n=1 Tax=Aphanothece hegewaldii CCALA 016 TaxID=2107694 RepID=A0A2T1LXH5_9CHRO|nr:PIN domain-containing protein [Aphanothece hegewaldii]PSF37058.1 PIN domain-containing protein [Aphanothece hegewaldii CCALA 016]